MKLDVIKSLRAYEEAKEDGHCLTRVTILFDHGTDVSEEDIKTNLNAQLGGWPFKFTITEIEREL